MATKPKETVVESVVTKKRVSLQEKIELFKKFSETKENLKGSTIFEGYPIGQWAIQIRNAIKNNIMNPSEKQLKALTKLGILDRQKGATIDEKIEMIIEWRKKYPKVPFTKGKVDEELKSGLRIYCSNEKQYEQLLAEYKKIQGYYKYVRERKCKGKLTTEQIKRCKEINIGRTFGYSKEVEEAITKYDLMGGTAANIVAKYGTIEDFLQACITGETRDREDVMLGRQCLINEIDIDKNPNIFRYIELCEAIFGKHEDLKLRIFFSKRIDKVLKKLNEKEQEVIIKRYGLVTGNRALPEIIGEEQGATTESIRKIESKGLRKLRRYLGSEGKLVFCWEDLKDNELLTEDEKVKIAKVDEVFMDIRLRNRDINDIDDVEIGELISLKAVLEMREIQDLIRDEDDSITSQPENKQELVKRIQQQQKTIAEQQAEIQRLESVREGVTNE